MFMWMLVEKNLLTEVMGVWFSLLLVSFFRRYLKNHRYIRYI